MRDDDQHTEDQYRHHRAAIECIMQRFYSGEISADQKRRYIADENLSYYRDEKMRGATNERLCLMPRIRNEVQAILDQTRQLQQLPLEG